MIELDRYVAARQQMVERQILARGSSEPRATC